MFKYLFNGTMYEADTLEELNTMLIAAGYQGNVIDEFEAMLSEEPEVNYEEEPLVDDEIDQMIDQLDQEELNNKDA